MDGRAVKTFEKRDSVHLVFGFSNYGHSTPSIPLTLNFLLSMYSHSRFARPKNHGFDDIEIN